MNTHSRLDGRESGICLSVVINRWAVTLRIVCRVVLYVQVETL